MSLDVELYIEVDTGGDEWEHITLYDANITHNLNAMATEAGIYNYLWRPEEIGATKAGDIIKAVESGLADMKTRPKHYKQFDSPNGWGVYRHFVPWVEKYLEACKKHPKALIHTSR